MNGLILVTAKINICDLLQNASFNMHQSLPRVFCTTFLQVLPGKIQASFATVSIKKSHILPSMHPWHHTFQPPQHFHHASAFHFFHHGLNLVKLF